MCQTNGSNRESFNLEEMLKGMTCNKILLVNTEKKIHFKIQKL